MHGNVSERIRIAAAGDVHASEAVRERVEAGFERLEDVDLVLLAGDLTTHGEPEQAVVIADAARRVEAPVVAVLGNHDYHAGREGEIARADLRIVLLHYAPVVETLAGEPAGIHSMLGSARLAIPIAEYQPDLVLHGHAHSGSFEGAIGQTPVYNVAVHVTGRDFYVFDLDVVPRRHPAIEVEAPT
jgi:putative phosphoesterase